LSQKNHKTLDAFCSKKHLDPTIAAHMKNWANSITHPPKNAKHKNKSPLNRRRVSNNIIAFVEDIINAPPPLFIKDGTIIFFKDEKRDKRIDELQKAYQKVILETLRHTSKQSPRETQTYLNQMNMLAAQIKLTWALFGLNIPDEAKDQLTTKNVFNLLNRDDAIVEAKLLPLFRVQARMRPIKGRPFPERLIELKHPRILPLASP